MLESLIERYGLGAIVILSPYVLDDGETLRWEVQINGKDVEGVDVRVEPLTDRSNVIVATLVRGEEELEFQRWTEDRYPHEPAQLMQSLRDLRESQGAGPLLA